jgi:Zn ribbon nucleic-acid-binding protein
MITRSVARTNTNTKNKRDNKCNNSYCCTMCNTTDSVQWRNSPSGERLCNKCGVRSQRLVAAVYTKKLDMEFAADGDGVKRSRPHPRVRVPIYRPQPRKRARKQSAPKRADFE